VSGSLKFLASIALTFEVFFLVLFFNAQSIEES